MQPNYDTMGQTDLGAQIWCYGNMKSGFVGWPREKMPNTQRPSDPRYLTIHCELTYEMRLD